MVMQFTTSRFVTIQVELMLQKNNQLWALLMEGMFVIIALL